MAKQDVYGTQAQAEQRGAEEMKPTGKKWAVRGFSTPIGFGWEAVWGKFWVRYRSGTYSVGNSDYESVEGNGRTLYQALQSYCKRMDRESRLSAEAAGKMRMCAELVLHPPKALTIKKGAGKNAGKNDHLFGGPRPVPKKASKK